MDGSASKWAREDPENVLADGSASEGARKDLESALAGLDSEDGLSGLWERQPTHYSGGPSVTDPRHMHLYSIYQLRRSTLVSTRVSYTLCSCRVFMNVVFFGTGSGSNRPVVVSSRQDA